MKQVTVIGCGVMGLSCGIRLLEAGIGVNIVARELPPNTTSNWAAAIWYPYRAYPMEKAVRWGKVAFDRFQTMLDQPETGVSNITLLELLPEVAGDPWWKTAVSHFRHAHPDEVPPGYAHAYVVTVPVIDTRVYMDYLVGRFQALGGTIEQREVRDLAPLLQPHQIVVNCSGLGARSLVSDEAVYPIRGQIVRVAAEGVTHSIIDEHGLHGLTYIVPRTHDIILGGTAQINDWNETPDEKTAETILQNSLALEPALQNLTILQHGVGLRPGRDAVRLEADPQPNGACLIHNYGHGGAGFTLSWGCAEEVLQLALNNISESSA